ncbi:MAG TPA: site-2 protease family protein [Polyangiaceae bacterium]|nr:site-2 protease family protein [Polyangiaceae bacterium]
MSNPRAGLAPNTWVAPAPSAPPDPGDRPLRTSSWSWRIGSLAGIPIRVHATFWLLLGWIALTHILQGHGARAIAAGLLLILSIFACVVLHELSHALVARRFGIGTLDITLLPIGGMARLEKMPEKPSQELLVALAGPVASLAIAAALFGTLELLDAPTALESLQVVGGPFLTKLMWFNVILAGFNLLPAFPMDGGRILRAGLAMRMDRGRATEVAARIGQGVAMLLGIWGFAYNPFLVIIAVFVWMGAKSEASLVQLRSALHGMPVRQAMITEFRVVAPEDSLSRAVDLTLAGFQQDFPVLEGTRLVGIVTHADLLAGLSKYGADAPIRRVRQQTVATAEPDELLELAFERLQSRQGRALVVVHDGAVVGLITPHNIGELLTMDEALRQSRTGKAERAV